MRILNFYYSQALNTYFHSTCTSGKCSKYFPDFYIRNFLIKAHAISMHYTELNTYVE